MQKPPREVWRLRRDPDNRRIPPMAVLPYCEARFFYNAVVCAVFTTNTASSVMRRKNGCRMKESHRWLYFRTARWDSFITQWSAPFLPASSCGKYLFDYHVIRRAYGLTAVHIACGGKYTAEAGNTAYIHFHG